MAHSHSATVYSLRVPDESAIRYVGVTTRPDMRPRQHLPAARKALKLGYGNPIDHWVLELAQAGKRPVFETLEVVPWAERFRREREWIQKLRRQGEPLLNVTHMRTRGSARKLRTRSAGAS